MTIFSTEKRTNDLKDKGYEQIEKIKKTHTLLEKAINKSKMIEDEDKEELLYSINFILYVVQKYLKFTKGGL